MGRLGRPLRRSTRRDEFHLKAMPHSAINSDAPEVTRAVF